MKEGLFLIKLSKLFLKEFIFIESITEIGS